jgi:hypothetical protein
MVDDHHGPLQTLNGSSIVTLYESPTGNKSTKPLEQPIIEAATITKSPSIIVLHKRQVG